MWRGPGGVVAVVVLTACGRLGFDVEGSADDTGDGGTSMFVSDVVFDETTTAVDRATDPGSAPRDGERVQLGDGSCPGYTGQLQQPYRAVLIENAGAQSVTVSAWATCIAGDGAVLTFYRRDTPPRTRAERMACVIGISDRGSPAVGTTTPCPGMLASDARGLPLAVGERASVWLQAEGTGATLPAMLHIETL